MKKLNKEELLEVNGGGISIGMGLGIAAGITFLIGVIDGQIKLKWQKLKNTEFIRNSKGKLLIQIQ